MMKNIKIKKGLKTPGGNNPTGRIIHSTSFVTITGQSTPHSTLAYRQVECLFVTHSTFFTRNEIYTLQLIFLPLCIDRSVYVRYQFALTKIQRIYVLKVQVFQFHQMDFERCFSEVHLFSLAFYCPFFANTNNLPKTRQRKQTSF